MNRFANKIINKYLNKLRFGKIIIYDSRSEKPSFANYGRNTVRVDAADSGSRKSLVRQLEQLTP